MIRNQVRFDQRVRKLERKHHAMGRGCAARLRPDGLVVFQPMRARVRLPMMPLVTLVAGLILFKAILLAAVGPGAYADRIDKLRAGTVIEKGGAWIMRTDPASAYIAGQIGPILR
jgi:hypothetical protein